MPELAAEQEFPYNPEQAAVSGSLYKTGGLAPEPVQETEAAYIAAAPERTAAGKAADTEDAAAADTARPLA